MGVTRTSNVLTDQGEPEDPVPLVCETSTKVIKCSTYVLKPRGFYRSVEVRPLQDLIPGHAYNLILDERYWKSDTGITLELYALSGAPPKHRNLCVVPLL